MYLALAIKMCKTQGNSSYSDFHPKTWPLLHLSTAWQNVGICNIGVIAGNAHHQGRLDFSLLFLPPMRCLSACCQGTAWHLSEIGASGTEGFRCLCGFTACHRFRVSTLFTVKSLQILNKKLNVLLQIIPCQLPCFVHCVSRRISPVIGNLIYRNQGLKSD